MRVKAPTEINFVKSGDVANPTIRHPAPAGWDPVFLQIVFGLAKCRSRMEAFYDIVGMLQAAAKTTLSIYVKVDWIPPHGGVTIEGTRNGLVYFSVKIDFHEPRQVGTLYI